MLGRNRRRFTTVNLLVAVGLLGGCGPDISAEVAAYADLVNEGRMATCVCFNDLGFDTMVSCEGAQGEISEDDEKCMLDAFAGEEDGAKAYLDCVAPVLEQYTQCIADDPGCQSGWADDCRMTRDNAINACPALSASTLDAFNICHL